jgi:hypothetical protein
MLGSIVGIGSGFEQDQRCQSESGITKTPNRPSLSGLLPGPDIYPGVLGQVGSEQWFQLYGSWPFGPN